MFSVASKEGEVKDESSSRNSPIVSTTFFSLMSLFSALLSRSDNSASTLSLESFVLETSLTNLMPTINGFMNDLSWSTLDLSLASESALECLRSMSRITSLLSSLS